MSCSDAEVKKYSWRSLSSCPAGFEFGRIEDAGDGLRPRQVGERGGVVAAVERIEADRVDRLRAPQAERVHPFAAPADHRRVEGDGENLLLRLPQLAGRVVDEESGLDRAAEADVVVRLAALELPQIAVRQPVFGQFDLLAVLDLLVEQPVHIADAVAVGRNPDRRHGLHEAGGEAPEAAIAEGGVGLEVGDGVEVDAEAAQRRPHRLDQAEIGDRVAEQSPDQELDRKIVHTLRAGPVGAAGRIHPAVDGVVANRQNRRRQPIMRPRDMGVLADGIGELAEDLLPQALGIAGQVRSLDGRRVIHGRKTRKNSGRNSYRIGAAVKPSDDRRGETCTCRFVEPRRAAVFPVSSYLARRPGVPACNIHGNDCR